jgi:A/G-specific adenine glycosylase
LRWFRRAQRDLPWRRNRDPYRIWISEIMLQQTQVTAVIPFFERFIKTFPSIADLAGAGEQDVLQLWEGLGYYRRARDLHRAARLLAERHGGRLPNDPIMLSSLPGMGMYTVGAVLSQAFERRLPALDANSLRLLCRLFGLKMDPQKSAKRRWLLLLAQTLLPQRGVGEFNQALMELGALVCTARSPRCDVCPLAVYCLARQKGIQAQLPFRPPRPEPVAIRESGVVIRRGDRVLLVQRPQSAKRWAGLWEFPHDHLRAGESHDQAALRIIKEFTGLSAAVGTTLATLRHSVTRHRIQLVCLAALFRSGKFRSDFYPRARWVRPAQLSNYPVSAPQRRIAELLNQSTPV